MNILISILIFVVVAYAAYWIITKFFPADIQKPVLLVVGVILLVVLLGSMSGAISVPHLLVVN